MTTWGSLQGIKDSGERVQYASGSLRDPSTGKIKWSRITFGPMMRRWAQLLTTAEAKYPDVAPGQPNFMLIETDEEFHRYKESAFRHFMSWFYDETDEDHAAAVFFNINGVEVIKDKNRPKEQV
jgi:dATP/dGTP diphosphohydrolase